jgi:hypothetical protein
MSFVGEKWSLMASVDERTKYDLQYFFKERTKLKKHCIATPFMH